MQQDSTLPHRVVVFYSWLEIYEGIEEYQIYITVYDVEERSIVKWTK